MKIELFEDMIWYFIQDNVCCDGCRYCAENGTSLTADDFKGSYARNLKELFESLIKEMMKNGN